jgi:hypothetical protein
LLPSCVSSQDAIPLPHDCLNRPSTGLTNIQVVNYVHDIE